jgi:hypothetical protein
MVVNYCSIYLITLAPDLQYIQGIRVFKMYACDCSRRTEAVFLVVCDSSMNEL